MDYEFDDVGDMQRRRDIEGIEGTELGLPGDRTLIVLAASDANPKWKAQSEGIARELRRLSNARAPAERVRRYMARKYAELLVIDWKGVRSKGVDLPYSIEACTAFLVVADDAYAAVDAMVYDTKNYRGARVEAVIETAKNS